MLRRTFDRGPRVDRFSPMQVECAFEVSLADPAGGDRELVPDDGRPIRCQGRVDLLAGDEHARYWVVAHRVVDGGSAGTSVACPSTRPAAAAGPCPTPAAPPAPDRPTRRRCPARATGIRRTRILRDPAELAAMGARLAAEALDMVDPGLRLCPPGPDHCGGCRLVAPCLAVERGNVQAALRAGYRDRGPERVEPGRLGSATWGTGRGGAPPRFGPG